MNSQISIICEDYFYKSESPEVRMRFALRVILTCKNTCEVPTHQGLE